MPTLVDLFKNKIISEGPNTGKTAENAYAIQDSKLVEIRTTNPRLQSFADKINKRRKEDGLRLKETRLEQDQLGLRSISDTSKLILYGGDYFRIINGTTRSKQLMLRSIGASGAGLDDSIADKVGSAIGNLAGDKIQNLFLKKDEQVPVKLDARALGLDIAADVASRTLGRLLPEPMIPSKVADEFEKGKEKSKENFIHEYDTDKKIIRLKNRKGIPKLIDGLLKNNKDILGQTKDVIMSTAGSIASNLVSSGIKGLSNAIFNKVKNTQVGGNRKAQPGNNTGFIWSSANPYSYARSKATLSNPDPEFTGDLATRFIKTRQAGVQSAFKGSLERFNLKAPSFVNAADITQNELNQALQAVKLEPVKHSDFDFQRQNSRYTAKGMSDGADAININSAVVYAGESADFDQNKKKGDDYDYIPLKFYSIYNNQTIQFRCTVNNLTETYSPSWDTSKFIGNPFPFYTYQGIERSVSFNFKVFSMNLIEHQLVWERINELATYTYPMAYKGAAGAVVPPLIKITLGNMYKGRECFIENLTFTVTEDTPWEIGMNSKLLTPVIPSYNTKAGFAYAIDEANTSTEWKLPMILDVEITVKFIESRANTNILYDYETPNTITP